MCEAPLASTVVAWMRLAMNRSLAAPMVLSAPATRYHEGIVVAADGAAGSLRVESAVGRWDAAATFVSDVGTSAAKIGRNALGLTVASGAIWPSGVWNVRTLSTFGLRRLPGAWAMSWLPVSPCSGANAAM